MEREKSDWRDACFMVRTITAVDSLAKLNFDICTNWAVRGPWPDEIQKFKLMQNLPINGIIMCSSPWCMLDI